MESILIRKFTVDDNIHELTELLHRGYKQLADMDLRFVATDQTSEITKKRIRKAECYIAVSDNKMIATIAYYPPDKTGGCDWYEKPEVAKFGQFCVEPEFQKQGIGTTLINLAEKLAIRDGAKEIALDTAEPATKLIEYYRKKGYEFVQYTQWGTTNYRSVVLSKKIKQ
jgi:GNAT superfamily N-acetyltransferase